MAERSAPNVAPLDYVTQPAGFRGIEIREAEPFLRDSCPYCQGDATRQYIDHDIYGGKNLAYVISPCERCGWWSALKFWEGHGNEIQAAAVCEPIVREFRLGTDDLTIFDALQTLARNPARLSELHAEGFERLVAEYLRSEGFSIDNIARIRSSGGDLVAIDRAGNKVLVEVKRWTDPVGIGVVWKLIGAMWEHDYDVGMVVSSGSFTRDTRESKAIATNRVSLKDFSHLADWLQIRRRRQGSVFDTCRDFVYADAMSEL